MSQKYVILKNLTEGPKCFMDHLGCMRTLAPLGQAEDTLKLVIEGRDIDGKDIKAFAEKFNSLKADEGFHIQFSDVDMNELVFKSKLTISPSAAANRDKTQELQARVQKEMHDKRFTEARLIRAKAEVLLRDQAAQPAQPAPVTGGTTVDARKQSIQPKLNEQVTDMLRQPKIVEVEEQGNVSFEALLALPMTELDAYAKQLSLVPRKGVSKKGLVNMILNAVDAGSRNTEEKD